MPLAGSIVWTLIGIAGAFLPPILAVWSMFIGTGFIASLGMMLSRFTGENFFDKNKPKNVFDSLLSGASLSPDGSHIAFRRGKSSFDGLWSQEDVIWS